MEPPPAYDIYERPEHACVAGSNPLTSHMELSSCTVSVRRSLKPYLLSVSRVHTRTEIRSCESRARTLRLPWSGLGEAAAAATRAAAKSARRSRTAAHRSSGLRAGGFGPCGDAEDELVELTSLISVFTA